jgi:hypothetical protein
MVANVNRESRGAAFHESMRWRCAGIFAGITLMTVVDLCVYCFEHVFGKLPFSKALGSVSIFIFVAAMILVETRLHKDHRLHCPQCGKFLGPGDFARIFKLGTCPDCGSWLPTTKPTRRQELGNYAFLVGAFLSGSILVGLMAWFPK